MRRSLASGPRPAALVAAPRPRQQQPGPLRDQRRIQALPAQQRAPLPIREARTDPALHSAANRRVIGTPPSGSVGADRAVGACTQPSPVMRFRSANPGLSDSRSASHGGRRDARRGHSHRWHVGMLRAGRTGRVLGFRPMAPCDDGSARRRCWDGRCRTRRCGPAATSGSLLGVELSRPKAYDRIVGPALDRVRDAGTRSCGRARSVTVDPTAELELGRPVLSLHAANPPRRPRLRGLGARPKGDERLAARASPSSSPANFVDHRKSSSRTSTRSARICDGHISRHRRQHHRGDRFASTRLVANAGLIPGTLKLERWVRGSANPGPKITVVAAMLAGATHIDRGTRRRTAVVRFRPWRPRSGRSGRTFGHAPARSGGVHAGSRLGGAPARRRAMWTPRSARSTANKNKAPLTPKSSAITRCSHAPTPARCRMRKGSAGSSRSASPELVASLRRAGAAGPTTVRGDSGFWSWKLIDRLDAHDFKWSITVALIPAVRAAIQAIPNTATPMPTDIAYTKDWRHHAFNANTARHRRRGRVPPRHAVVELAIRDLKEGTGLEHVPSGHYGANCAPLACAPRPQHRPLLTARQRPRTAPAAPDSSPSPPCWSTDPAHPPCDTPPAGPGKHNSEPHSALSGLCPDPQADPNRPEPAPPHKPSVDNEPLWLCWRLIGLVFQPRLGWSCGQRRTLLRILLAGCRCSGRGAVAG